MAVTLHGKSGNVWWDASDGVNRVELESIQSWSADISVDVVEKTSMGDTWKTRVVGMKDWSATVECLAPDSGPQIDFSDAEPQPMGGAAVYLELYTEWDDVADEYTMIYGLARCTGVSKSTSSDGVGTLSYTFTGEGEIATYTSSTARKTYT